MHRVLTLSLVLTFATSCAQAPASDPADVILHGGVIHTGDPDRPRAEAVAIRGGRFVLVGGSDEALRLRGPATEVVDLAGGTVVPGLQDAHAHVVGLGASLETLDLRDTPSREAIIGMVRARAASAAPGEWILGRGWDQNDWPEQSWPTAADLDRAAPDHPVFLRRIDGHASWANSKALAAAGVTAATRDPEGGRLIRDGRGRPTGVLIDRAQALVGSHVPPPSAAQIEARVRAADRECRRLGLTMVHDAGASDAEIEIYRRLAAAGELGTRLYVLIDGAAESRRGWFARGPELDQGRHQVVVRAVKLYADGALGSRGAALLEDYADEPGTRGLLVTAPEALEATALDAARAGFQVGIHAIGDRANRLALDAFARVEREVPGARALRPRIEHAQILDEADIPRFAALGVIASMQATHATSDMPWVPARIGEARAAEGAYAWQKLRAAGAVLANGSDFPVERPDPLLGFYAAVTRRSPDGEPPGGWLPDERLSRDEALHSFTLGAAWAAHAENDLGSIAPGKLADLVVLSRDIMTVPAPEILRTAVVRTMVGGRTVFLKTDE